MPMGVRGFFGIIQTVPNVVIGVDLGGTNVRAGAFFEDGSPAGPNYENPSRAQDGTDAIVEALSHTIHQAIGTAAEHPTHVGLAIPGHVDNTRGIVRWAPNFGKLVNGVFESWRDVSIREPLEHRLNLPVVMGNDANLAALGEYKFGTGRGTAKCLVMLTVGTGIGGGVVMAPQSVMGDASGPLVLVGSNQGGAELGHIVIQANGLDCNAGSYGSLEAYCQRDSIVQRAVHRLRRGRTSLLADLVEGDFSRVTPRLISQAATEGDEMAIEVWSEVGTMLGNGIGTLINVFAPDVFPIGGQIAKAGDFLLKPAIAAARNCAVTSLFDECNITLAEQVEDAGMLGAAALAFEAKRWSKG